MPTLFHECSHCSGLKYNSLLVSYIRQFYSQIAVTKEAVYTTGLVSTTSSNIYLGVKQTHSIQPSGNDCPADTAWTLPHCCTQLRSVAALCFFLLEQSTCSAQARVRCYLCYCTKSLEKSLCSQQGNVLCFQSTCSKRTHL